MEMATEDLPSGVTRVRLNGRLDIDGAHVIDLRMNALAAARKALLIDMADVSYVASLGLRTLITCARASAQRGHRIAIACPQPAVLKVLNISGTHDVIPIHDSIEAAEQSLVA